MTSVRLSENLEKKLDHLSIRTKRTKSFYIQEALSWYLEDIADAYEALDRLAEPDAEYITTAELLRRLKNNKKQK